LTSLPEKLSVSVLTPSALDGDEGEEAQLTLEADEKRADKRGILPEFISGTKADESARRGIATHAFMQFFDISFLLENGVAAELERLFKEGFISEEDKARVRLDEIELFTKSALFSEMKNAERLVREFRFNTRLPAEYFTENEEKAKKLRGSMLLVQGVIDCIIEDKDGELHLVDYKTDRLSKQELADSNLARKTLEEKHSRQLSYYCLAIKKIFGKAPKTVRVYSLPLGEALDIKNLDF
jgi:ATP-dependent helicase/nuclease subunit A